MKVPFDQARLDEILARERVDVVIATSRHNVRYLLGSYSSFHRHFDAIGIDRYQPAVVYRRGAPEQTLAVGAPIDRAEHEARPLWTPAVFDGAQTSAEAAAAVAAHVIELGLARETLAIERAFAPETFMAALREALPEARFVEAWGLFEALRAIKRPDELESMRIAAEGIVEAMVAVATWAPAGATTQALADRLRVEEALRGVGFEYLLVAAGQSFNRAPSEQPWGRGDVLSLDSGGERDGYIGDLCRMAVRGPATARMREVLDQVRAVQDAARAPIRAGAPGREIYAAADRCRADCPDGEAMVFVAHGMGLVAHEAPRLTDSGPIRYPAAHRDLPLQAGMVLSIETDVRIAGVGLIKLEDTVAVTESGWTGFGDAGRDWIEVDT
jgi:Xaa-Pro aminopeptidase